MSDDIDNLRKELSAFKEGIKPEDADKDKTYIIKGIGEYPFLFARFSWDDDYWYISRDSKFARAPEFLPDDYVRLYPLPQQKEES
jgi:hypothetical protein